MSLEPTAAQNRLAFVAVGELIAVGVGAILLAGRENDRQSLRLRALSYDAAEREIGH